MDKQITLSYNFSEDDLLAIRAIVKDVIEEAVGEFGTKQRQSANFKSTKDACEALNITRPTLDKYRKQGRIIGSKVGGKWFYSEHEIKVFIDGGIRTSAFL